MTPKQKEALALLDRIHRGVRDRVHATERAAMARGEPLDSKHGAPARPRHDMVEKLNAIVMHNALLSGDEARLARIHRARQSQLGRDTERSRFAQAVGQQESSGRVDGQHSRLLAAIGPQERGRIAFVPFDGGGRR